MNLTLRVAGVGSVGSTTLIKRENFTCTVVVAERVSKRSHKLGSVQLMMRSYCSLEFRSLDVARMLLLLLLMMMMVMMVVVVKVLLVGNVDSTTLIKLEVFTCIFVVAERVSKRFHQLGSVQLTVERLTACPPPPVIVADVDDEKLLFTGLPVTRRGKDAAAAAAADDGGESDEDDEQKLKNFVQTAAGAEILHVTYSTQRDNAVITFRTTPG